MSPLLGCARCSESLAQLTTHIVIRRRTPDVERSRVNELFTQGRSAPGSRCIKRMRDEGEKIGRSKVRSLIRDLALVSKQPGSNAYKKSTVEWPDIPNILNRAVDVEAAIRSSMATSLTFGRRANGTTWLLSWSSMHAEWWPGPCQQSRTQTSWSKRWTWLANNAANLKGYCSTPTKGRNMAVVSSTRDCGATACARL